MDPIAMRQNQVPSGYQVPGRCSWLELRSGEYWSVNSVSIWIVWICHPQVLSMVTDSLRYWVRDMHVDGFRFDTAAALARELHDVECAAISAFEAGW